MVQALPLVHSASTSAFKDIAADKLKAGFRLLSPAKLAEYRGDSLDPESAEDVLGTADFVFLYCGQCRRGGTQAGFLFSRSLEDERGHECAASPFDSGALHGHAVWPEATETARAFLARHTLPVPAYRDYLAERLLLLFADAADYLRPGGRPVRPDPIGLAPKPPETEPDPRLWTFEVRAPGQVELAPPHLQAVFFLARLERFREVRNLLAAQHGLVHFKTMEPEDADDFNALQRHCLDYLQDKGIF